MFEGPLDLLLHLIRKNEVDIRDIPIAEITSQYLVYLEIIKELNLDGAGEFLLMAATLLHIKSRTLLPLEETPPEDEEDDPRAELVKRLLEYQQYRDAGLVLGARALLGREVFTCAGMEEQAVRVAEEAPLEVSLYELIDAFRALIARIPREQFHEVLPEDALTIADCINEIIEIVHERDIIPFDELVGALLTRERTIVVFLSLLELTRITMVRLVQNQAGGSLWIIPVTTRELLDSGTPVSPQGGSNVQRV